MHSIRRHHRRGSRRAGLYTPMVAVALVVVLSGLALVLDRLWLAAARVELVSAAEGAALAAAREIFCDERLTNDPQYESIAAVAMAAAGRIALDNRVAGEPVELSVAEQGDVRIGRLETDPQTGEPFFVDDEAEPELVVVTAQHTRARANPVRLFLSGLTQVPYGDVASRVAVSISNRVTGIEPFAGAPAPLLPLAIKSHRLGMEQVPDDWESLIERRGGTDDWSIGRDGLPQKSSDGIPEITLQGETDNNRPWEPNLRWIDLGTGLNSSAIARLLKAGVTAKDLSPYDGKLMLDGAGSTESFPCTTKFIDGARRELEELLGQPRFAVLYDPVKTLPGMNCVATQLVAVRILDIRNSDNGSPKIVLQPCVMSSRTVLTAATNDVAPNPYIVRFHVEQ